MILKKMLDFDDFGACCMAGFCIFITMILNFD